MHRGTVAALVGLALLTTACGLFDSTPAAVYSCNCPTRTYPSCDDVAASSGYTLSSDDLAALQATCVSDSNCAWSATSACPTASRAGTCSHLNENAGYSVPINELLRYYTPFQTGQDATCVSQGGQWSWN
jgi:hypothetical protein